MPDKQTIQDILKNRLALDQTPPALGVVLGSGQGDVANALGLTANISYDDIFGMPPCSVEGHAGTLGLGEVANKPTLVFQGRFHRYEDRSWSEVVSPVEMLFKLGVKKILLTTSSGAVNQSYSPGDAVVITDHLNLQGTNPVRELAQFGKESFLDLSGLYWSPADEQLQKLAIRCGVRAHKGVLASMPGPVYETPAEVRMLRVMGADIVSMSTAPEAIWARYRGISVAGLSIVTNAACHEGNPLSHGEVLAGAKAGAENFAGFLRDFAEQFVVEVE